MNKFEYKNLTPFKWFVLENFPFIEADFDALTEWQLFCKLGKEINKVINSTNTLGTQVETLTDYVSNYFDNLDVQDEINNKLNEMAEDGTLEEIISSYLNIKAFLGFNNVAEMKVASNLINGSFVKTLGFYNKNDEGGSTYKIRNITNNDVVDEMTIISLANHNLIAELIYSDKINIKQLGAKGDGNNDDTVSLIKSLSICDNVIIPDGTYKITDEIEIEENKTLIGNNENTIIKYYGTGNCFILNGRFITIKNLKILADESIVSPNKIAITINPNILEEPSRSTFTNILIESCFIDKFNKGISLDIMWHVTIRNTIIKGIGKGSEENRNCYGISYENSGTILANWSGSGNIIESCTIENCSYALHIDGGWNVTCLNTIIENNYCSIYNYRSNRTLIINCWFENNDIHPVLQSELIMIGGRKNVLSDNNTLEFPNDLNNLHLIYTDGDTINKYNQKLMSNIANEEAILTGIKNQVPTNSSTKIASLKSFTSIGNAITSENFISNNNLTGELSLVAGATSGGTSGKTYTELEFSSGQTDGNNVDIALRSVFKITKDGKIFNPNSNESVDIGESSHKYRFIWCKNVIVLGDDNNLYKLGVDSSGNPKATRV